MRFKGKCVVVTGASSGMGRKIALDFAKRYFDTCKSIKCSKVA